MTNHYRSAPHFGARVANRQQCSCQCSPWQRCYSRTVKLMSCNKNSVSNTTKHETYTATVIIVAVEEYYYCSMVLFDARGCITAQDPWSDFPPKVALPPPFVGVSHGMARVVPARGGNYASAKPARVMNTSHLSLPRSFLIFFASEYDLPPLIF